jgi:hypothetical protein
MKTKGIVLGLMIACAAGTVMAQEGDDMYFNSKDRAKLDAKKAKEVTTVAPSNASESTEVDDSDEFTPTESYSTRNTTSSTITIQTGITVRGIQTVILLHQCMGITALTTMGTAAHGTQDCMVLSAIAGARLITAAIGVQDIALGTMGTGPTVTAIHMYHTMAIAGHITAEDGTTTTTTGVVIM